MMNALRMKAALLKRLRRATSVALLSSAIVLPVGSIALASPALAATPTTLAGENLVAGGEGVSGGQGCGGTYPRTFSFSAYGLATGPIPGFFDETGTFTLGSPDGPVTQFDANFSIRISPAGQTVAAGIKTLAPGVTANGGCAAGTVPGFTETGAFITSAPTTYQVTFPFAESGAAPVTADFRFPYSFQEGLFTPTQDGCDDNGQGNGNDQCQQ